MTKKKPSKSRKQSRAKSKSKSKSKSARRAGTKRSAPKSRAKPARTSRPARAARATATRDFVAELYDVVCTVEQRLNDAGLEFGDAMEAAAAHNAAHAGETPAHHAEPRQQLPPANDVDA
jgi:hypothetical protein